MESNESLVAVVSVLVVFGMPIAYLIAHRYYSHQERMAMIQRGLAPPDPRWAKRAARDWSDHPGYAPANGYDPYGYGQWQADRALRKGISVGMCGLALFIGLSFINPGRPGPWLLGGLIPLFVGIAQVIIALLGGARIGPLGFCPPSGPPPPGAPKGAPEYESAPFNATPQAPQGPYGWRPGNTVELEKPPRPPEPRP